MCTSPQTVSEDQGFQLAFLDLVGVVYGSEREGKKQKRKKKKREKLLRLSMPTTSAPASFALSQDHVILEQNVANSHGNLTQ